MGARPTKESIGNLKLEFYTAFGSFDLEAWKGTGVCRVTTRTDGVRRRTETKLGAEQWDSLSSSLAGSGFWTWAARYDSAAPVGAYVSWSLGVGTDSGWFLSSGDGTGPEGLFPLVRSLTLFTQTLECRETDPASRFLSPFFGTA